MPYSAAISPEAPVLADQAQSAVARMRGVHLLDTVTGAGARSRRSLSQGPGLSTSWHSRWILQFACEGVPDCWVLDITTS